MELKYTIEAILFYKAEPATKAYLAKFLGKNEEEIEEALNELREELLNRGLVLVSKEGEVTLGTNNEVKDIIEKIAQEEVSGPLTKASIEALSIIVYKGPITKGDIDYIRGVNSHFILRNLLIRGLIERVPNPKDARTFLYKPTFDLLSYLGVSSVKEMPEYEEYSDRIRKAALEKEEDEKNEEDI